MKINDRVLILYGEGTVIEIIDRSKMEKLYLVKVDNCPDHLLFIQKHFGGLFFDRDEIRKI